MNLPSSCSIWYLKSKGPDCAVYVPGIFSTNPVTRRKGGTGMPRSGGDSQGGARSVVQGIPWTRESRPFGCMVDTDEFRSLGQGAMAFRSIRKDELNDCYDRALDGVIDDTGSTSLRRLHPIRHTRESGSSRCRVCFSIGEE